MQRSLVAFGVTWLVASGCVRRQSAPALAQEGVRDIGRSQVAIPSAAGIGACRYQAHLFAAQNYEDPRIVDLETPLRDVEKLAEVLASRFGFETVLHKDATEADIADTLFGLRDTISDCDGLLIYFAGHGELDDEGDRGFWLPVDARPGSPSTWISTDDVVASVKALSARHVLVIADSCFSGSLFRYANVRDLSAPATMEGLQKLAQRRSRWVLTSGGEEPVVDEYRDGMSVFAYFLHLELSEADDPFLVPDTVFPKVRELVQINTDQVPQQGPFSGHEGGQLVLLNRGASPPPPALGAGDPWTSPSGVVFRWVPGGTFTMGSPDDEEGRDDDERQHVVTLDGLWVMQTEVTQGLWSSVMGGNPSAFDACGEACPVQVVSWFDAVQFANKLSTQDGLQPTYVIRGDKVKWKRVADGYRLLTEAEWEYAARGGEGFTYAGSDELDEVGMTSVGHSQEVPCGGYRVLPARAVCGKRANGYGLCDMTGNVSEWVWDWYAPQYPSIYKRNPRGPETGSDRVFRGGSWATISSHNARVAGRDASNPGKKYANVGLRLARPAP